MSDIEEEIQQSSGGLEEEHEEEEEGVEEHPRKDKHRAYDEEEEEEDENSPEFKKLKGKARIKIQYRFIKPSTQSNAAPMTPMTPASIPAFIEEPRIAPRDEEEDEE